MTLFASHTCPMPPRAHQLLPFVYDGLAVGPRQPFVSPVAVPGGLDVPVYPNAVSKGGKVC